MAPTILPNGFGAVARDIWRACSLSLVSTTILDFAIRGDVPIREMLVGSAILIASGLLTVV